MVQNICLTSKAPYKACSAFTRVTACTLALSPIRDTLIEGFSHFVTSMTAPMLPDQSTIIRVRPSLTDSSRPRGARSIASV